MQAAQLRQLEAELWRAADQLRANSKLTASEYSMPVLGLIFLRHAYNRYLRVRDEVEKDLPLHPQRGRRPIAKKDFEERSAMFLPEQAQFDYLVSLPEGADIGAAIDQAMKLIEDEYDSLKGVLPRNYSIFSKELLRELLRIFNKEILQKANGDLFGKIYEYFLNKFAMTGAQEGGEFFTPMSLVQTIVNVIEPDHGIVLDPACGSAGMFVQTGYFIESEGLKPAERATFYGQEKTEMNTRLARMNLAVHGLEGNIQEGNTFYEDKHDLAGRCDFVMANPPFNVDGVDKGKDAVKKDPRLLLGGKVCLPKNDNANYLWILYFYNYLKPTGRAGFVMSSAASDAGHSEKDIREKLVKTGTVDVMMAIGNNFFYTRSLPCTLWFFDRGKERLNFDSSDFYDGHDKKPVRRRDTVLMLDARKIFRKVTSKINDFSPEQLQNLICIVNLYRGKPEIFTATVNEYLITAANLAAQTYLAYSKLQTLLASIHEAVSQFAAQYVRENPAARPFLETLNQLDVQAALEAALPKVGDVDFEDHARIFKPIRKSLDKIIKEVLDILAGAQKEYQLNKSKDWKDLNLKEQLDRLKALQHRLSGNPAEENPGLLLETEYFWKQAQWLRTRFPDGAYLDVEGLCKVVTLDEIAAKDWSLSPGRYVGVDASPDEDFDYEERLREIHGELEELNEEAAALARIISENYKEVGG